MPNATTLLIIGAIAALLLFGKDAPLKAIFAKLAALLPRVPLAPPVLPATPTTTADVPTTAELKSRLPDWIDEPNDLQLMLLHLGHHAMRHGNEALKDQTFKLMKSFADLQVKPPESGQ